MKRLDPVTSPWLVTLVVVLLLGIGAAFVRVRKPRFRPAS
jgi:F0F1-type ATP synthase assembly protein I